MGGLWPEFTNLVVFLALIIYSEYLCLMLSYTLSILSFSEVPTVGGEPVQRDPRRKFLQLLLLIQIFLWWTLWYILRLASYRTGQKDMESLSWPGCYSVFGYQEPIKVHMTEVHMIFVIAHQVSHKKRSNCQVGICKRQAGNFFMWNLQMSVIL